jgi:thiosulfate/3-mercaptopyruvate sulfurtransferase
MMLGKRLVRAVILWMTLMSGLPGHAQGSSPVEAPLSATSVPETQLMQPAELVRILKASEAEKPVLFQVGSYVMFQQAHIPGAEYAGPGSRTAGLELLEKMVAALGKNQPIVIYCGCCPWNRCPNIGPAYKKLHDLGFTNVKALYVAKNLGDDWVAKGYPVEKSE